MASRATETDRQTKPSQRILLLLNAKTQSEQNAIFLLAMFYPLSGPTTSLYYPSGSHPDIHTTKYNQLHLH